MPKLLQYLPIAGFGSCLIWMQAPTLESGEFAVYYRLARAITFFLLAFLFSKKSLSFRKWMMWASSGLMVFPLMFYSLGFYDRSFMVFVPILSGIGFACCFAMWFNEYSRYGLRHATNFMLISYLLAAVVRLILVVFFSYMGTQSLLFYYMFPFVSATLYHYLFEKSRNSDEAVTSLYKNDEHNYRFDIKSVEKKSNASFAITAALCCVLVGVLPPISDNTETIVPVLIFGNCIRVTFAFLTLLGVNSFMKNKGMTTMRTAAILLVICVLAVTFFSDYAAIVVASAASASQNLLMIILTLVMLRLAISKQILPTLVIGVCYGLYELFRVIGLLIYRIVPAVNPEFSLSSDVALFIYTCFFLLIFCVFYGGEWIPMVSLSDKIVIIEAESINKKCMRLGSKYHLSDREIEIMILMCKGTGKKHIAALLFLSEGTVRWHSANIYRKLEVHSKQELLSLIEVS